MALANPKCKNCCVDGASPEAKYMACGMQRVAKMLINLETKGSLGSDTADKEAANVCSASR